MTAKTYDGQTARFLASVATCIPPLSGDVMQGWINNPPALKKFLRGLNPSVAEEKSFLKKDGKVLVGEPKVITINRGRFNPAEFIGEGWSVVDHETDARSTALTKLDLTKVEQVTMLSGREPHIKGEEKLKRLKASDYIRLDADIFLTLWENQHLIPESWKEKVNGNTRFIYFDGTVLRRSVGGRGVLCLCWNDVAWSWNVIWLGENSLDDSDPSAVLAS